jgi:RHS repeat-associated protein
LAPDGQRTSVTETAGAQQTVVTWDYDNLNRLVLEDYNAPGDTNDFLHDYVYDLVGNRTKKTADASVVTTYSYNNADQLTQETTDGNSIVYSYDDNGALTFKDSDTDPNVTYGYNLRGRLAQVDIENGATVEYFYNADGIRVRSVVDGNATDYVIDSHNHTGYAQVLKEVGGANTVYVTGLDVLAQVTGASAPQYLSYDGHGSVRALTNNAGSVVERYNYEAYGTLHKFTGTPATNLLYSGEWRDQQTGLDNLRSRWYNPANGRFNRMDKFAGNNRDPQSLHKYLYAQCNPVNAVDPSGQFSVMAVAAAAILWVAILLIGYKVSKGVLNARATKGATAIVPGTHAYRGVEIALSFLQDAVGIPNSGVPQSDVHGLRMRLQSGGIYMLPSGARQAGRTWANLIYVRIEDHLTNGTVFSRLPEADNAIGRTDYTISNYPHGIGFWDMYGIASTLYHEWQHAYHGAHQGAPLEYIPGSRWWKATHGKEARLATAVIEHLKVDGSAIERKEKLRAVQTTLENTGAI